MIVTVQCEHCTASFQTEERRLKHGRGRFCSRKCLGAHSKPVTPIQIRFWRKIQYGPMLRPDIGACWSWTAAMTVAGYGCFRINGKSFNTNRIAWTLAMGPIPDGLQVLHRCDNRACVRPDHLFLGTHADNMADMVAKGRASKVTRRGPDSNFFKLSDADVVAIRQLYAAGTSARKVARQFGISKTYVRDLVAERYRPSL